MNGHRVPAAALLLVGIMTNAAAEPDVMRQRELVHIVRQDCGSCHGLTLQGGLGPALTAAALHEREEASLAATIMHGRPGTPMPPFRGILDDSEVHWIARQLRAGFPSEP